MKNLNEMKSLILYNISDSIEKYRELLNKTLKDIRSINEIIEWNPDIKYRTLTNKTPTDLRINHYLDRGK